MRAEKRTIAAVAATMKMLSNENRLRILYALHEKPKTWTQLMFELRINPRALQHHLSYLKRNRVITENKPHGYKLTKAGLAFMELSIEDVVTTVKKAREIVGEKKDPSSIGNYD